MNIKLTFLGAAQNVTGSCYLVEHQGKRILVDCGFFQERAFKDRNWAPFPVDPKSIQTVLLTHAHLDHCGLLPKLVKEGFSGRILCTPATADIAGIILLDSAHIQEEDAIHKRKRHEKEGRKGPHPEEPLYTTENAQEVLPLFDHAPYTTPIALGGGMEASFHEAGHIFGSAMIKLKISEGAETRTIIFSGDVGRWDIPLIKDPTSFEQADYVLTESTYGNRLHGDVASIPDKLADIINETHQAGGNILIPSFAVERTQELLFHLGNLLRDDRIPHLMAFVDSPMAIRVTEVFQRHPELFDAETRALLKQGAHPCDFPGLTMTRTADSSKSINHIHGSAIIIAGSGMCTGGRIKHHLVNNISRPETTLLFVGYQAQGTLGRVLLERPDEVRIFGQMHPVEARIEKLNGFSAHADRDELYRWLSSIKTPPRRVFITHGEAEAASSFQKFLHEKTGWNTHVAEYKETVILD